MSWFDDLNGVGQDHLPVFIRTWHWGTGGLFGQQNRRKATARVGKGPVLRHDAIHGTRSWTTPCGGSSGTGRRYHGGA